MVSKLLRRTPIVPVAVAVLALLVVSAVFTAPTASAHAARVTDVLIEAHNTDHPGHHERDKFWFTMSSTRIPSGLVEVIFENHGTVAHEAQLVKLKPGVSDSTLLQALMAPDFKAFLKVASAAGGAGSIEAGRRQDTLMYLSPGTYVVVCFDSGPGPDPTPHVFRGMHTRFTVFDSHRGGSAWEDSGQLRSPDGLVTLQDFRITIPAVMRHSRFLFIKVWNKGPQTHQMQLLRVRNGHSIGEVIHCFQTMACPPPVDDYGGMDALAPHTVGWVELDLRPGTYIAICFVPDVNKPNTSHAQEGMETIFTVR